MIEQTAGAWYLQWATLTAIYLIARSLSRSALDSEPTMLTRLQQTKTYLFAVGSIVGAIALLTSPDLNDVHWLRTFATMVATSLPVALLGVRSAIETRRAVIVTSAGGAKADQFSR
jgi:hypothetical protein